MDRLAFNIHLGKESFLFGVVSVRPHYQAYYSAEAVAHLLQRDTTFARRISECRILQLLPLDRIPGNAIRRMISEASLYQLLQTATHGHDLSLSLTQGTVHEVYSSDPKVRTVEPSPDSGVLFTRWLRKLRIRAQIEKMRRPFAASRIPHQLKQFLRRLDPSVSDEN